jgi:hypothetical protein
MESKIFVNQQELQELLELDEAYLTYITHIANSNRPALSISERQVNVSSRRQNKFSRKRNEQPKAVRTLVSSSILQDRDNQIPIPISISRQIPPSNLSMSQSGRQQITPTRSFFSKQSVFPENFSRSSKLSINMSNSINIAIKHPFYKTWIEPFLRLTEEEDNYLNTSTIKFNDNYCQFIGYYNEENGQKKKLYLGIFYNTTDGKFYFYFEGKYCEILRDKERRFYFARIPDTGNPQYEIFTNERYDIFLWAGSDQNQYELLYISNSEGGRVKGYHF